MQACRSASASVCAIVSLIVPDEASAPIIRKMFEWYAQGDMSAQEVTNRARAAGFMFRKSGGRIPKSTVAAILRNRIYTGRFDWDGKTYQGRYETCRT
jgi:site-specific DNA recombinase